MIPSLALAAATTMSAHDQRREDRDNSDCNHCDGYDTNLWFHIALYFLNVITLQLDPLEGPGGRLISPMAVANIDTNHMPPHIFFG